MSRRRLVPLGTLALAGLLIGGTSAGAAPTPVTPAPSPSVRPVSSAETRASAFAPVSFYKDLIAKIGAHEIGHLLGGHHHYRGVRDGSRRRHRSW